MTRKATPKAAPALTLDPHNANAGTQRGATLLHESIETCGVGRSILVDKHGVVISGNKTLVEARAQGIDVEIVQATGNELVVVQRTDLSLDDARARRLAYYDNRVGELDLSWSVPQIQQDLTDGINVGVAFFPNEIDDLLKGAKHTAEPVPGPDYSAATPPRSTTPAPPVERNQYMVVFETVEQQRRWEGFMVSLAERYKGIKTTGARLAAYLAEPV
jgi:hypothetical protein